MFPALDSATYSSHTYTIMASLFQRYEPMVDVCISGVACFSY